MPFKVDFAAVGGVDPSEVEIEVHAAWAMRNA